MPNANYLKGRRKEYSIVDEFRKKGFDIVQRTAGSHSPIDVIAISKELLEIVLVQSKPDNISSNKKEKILKDNEFLNNNYKVRFILR